jgi:hypothetical protein
MTAAPFLLGQPALEQRSAHQLIPKLAGARRKMRLLNLKDESGKIGYIILWLLGVPASILLLIFLLRGCT